MRYMILAGLLLAGCDTAAIAPAQRAAQGAGPDTCNAAAFQTLVGQDAASALALPEPKRLAGPLDPVTTDFLPDRLNVQLDATDTIIAVTCG